MKYLFSISKIPLLIFISVIAFSCSRSHPVVPGEIDEEEIYKALVPNEDESSRDLTFGPDSIPGFVFDYEMTTENPDIYIFLDNLTVMDINPAVNQDIMDFVYTQLSEYGYIAETTVLAPDEMEQLLGRGFNYAEATGEILDGINKAFDERYPEISSYRSPFNAYFQIYPLWLNDKIVTYRLTAYCYTGGAHGMTISYIRSYDLQSGKKLTFDDIVTPGEREYVREEIAAHMAYAYPIYENITTVEQYLDSLNVWLENFDSSEKGEKITAKDYPAPDVALISQGLVSVYQMYELTPGSDGCPVVVIPYANLKGCLTYQLEE